jgi:uncharacterized damage-inducible protein DinB
MIRQTHLQMWDQQRMRHGITLRVLDQIPADKLASHPIAGMRTPIELVVHMYTGAQMFSEAAAKGAFGHYDDKATAAGIATKDQLVAFVNQAWAAADANAKAATDASLATAIKTPWGDFTGMAMMGILYDEYLHHRGQLYAFVRALGSEPVMMWDFDRNADAFKPGAAAQA